MATFEELTGLNPVPTAPVERPLDTLHGTGSDTRRQQGDEAAELAEETTVGEAFGAAWERNISNMFYDDVQRKWEHTPDDTFDAGEWVTENKDTLPGINLEAYQTVRSVGEAEELRDDMLRAEENDAMVASKGLTGVGASIVAGLVDPAELAIAVSTVGVGKVVTISKKAATTTAMLGKGASTVRKVTTATVDGLVGGAVSGAAAHQVDPITDAKQIVVAGLTGAILSGSIGLGANVATGKARRGYAEAVDDLPNAAHEPTEPALFTMPDSPQSLGAGFIGDVGDTVDAEGFTPEARSIFDQAMETIRTHDLGTRLEDTDLNQATPEGRTAKRFSDFLADSKWAAPLRTDFDRLMSGGSRIESALAFNLLESAEGRIRNNRSATMLAETYEQRLSSHSLPVLDGAFTDWAKARDMGVLDKHAPDARATFDREIALELEARFHEGRGVTSDAAIKTAADAVDRNMADAIPVAKGRDGEASVSGFEDMQAKSGFFRHMWSGSSIRKAMAKGHSSKKIEALLDAGFRKSNPHMDPAHTLMVSKAVMRRAMAKEDGIDTNMLNTLDSDAQTYLRETLVDSGIDEKTVDNLIDSIRGRKEEQSKLSTAKTRTAVDLRIADGDLTLMDLVDSNMTRMLSQYNREIAGNAALARKGIQNRQHRKAIIDAALQERRGRGIPSGSAEREFLEDMFTYFDSGPIGGGVTPVVSRAKRLTNLALLNQMGMTQMGESGAQIAAVGMDTWKRHASTVFKEMRSQGPAGPLVSELRPILGNVGQDHLLFRDDLMMDEMRLAKDANSFLGKLDFALGKGQRIQGYASGFYHVKSFQQKVAVASMADKAMQRLRDGTDAAELADIGVPQSLKKYIDAGTVVFDTDGYLDRLNLDQWAPEDAEDLALALNRHTHQVVQKALAGEETMWMHKSVGSLYMHLKSFPMAAMRKQALRTSAISRPLAVATLTMGLATAGLAYEAKQIINGKTDRVSPADFAKGAFGMSNMTGWVPMLADPAAAILGMDDLRFNQYGRHDIGTGVISLPPVFPTLNKMARIPGTANPFSGLSDNEKIRILQATPLVGNAYGFSAIFNAMKD